MTDIDPKSVKDLQNHFYTIRALLGNDPEEIAPINEAIFRIIREDMTSPEELNDFTFKDIAGLLPHINTALKEALTAYAEELKELTTIDGAISLDRLEEEYVNLGKAVFAEIKEDDGNILRPAGFSASNWSFNKKSYDSDPTKTPAKPDKTPGTSTPPPSEQSKSGNGNPLPPKSTPPSEDDGDPTETKGQNEKGNTASAEGSYGRISTDKDLTFSGEKFNKVTLTDYQRSLQAGNYGNIATTLNGHHFGVLEFQIDRTYIDKNLKTLRVNSTTKEHSASGELTSDGVIAHEKMYDYASKYLFAQINRLGLEEDLQIVVPTRPSDSGRNYQYGRDQDDDVQYFEAVQVCPNLDNPVAGFQAMITFLRQMDHDDSDVIKQRDKMIADLEARLPLMMQVQKFLADDFPEISHAFVHMIATSEVAPDESDIRVLCQELKEQDAASIGQNGNGIDPQFRGEIQRLYQQVNDPKFQSLPEPVQQEVLNKIGDYISKLTPKTNIAQQLVRNANLPKEINLNESNGVDPDDDVYNKFVSAINSLKQTVDNQMELLENLKGEDYKPANTELQKRIISLYEAIGDEKGNFPKLSKAEMDTDPEAFKILKIKLIANELLQEMVASGMPWPFDQKTALLEILTPPQGDDAPKLTLESLAKTIVDAANNGIDEDELALIQGQTALLFECVTNTDRAIDFYNEAYPFTQKLGEMIGYDVVQTLGNKWGMNVSQGLHNSQGFTVEDFYNLANTDLHGLKPGETLTPLQIDKGATFKTLGAGIDREILEQNQNEADNDWYNRNYNGFDGVSTEFIEKFKEFTETREDATALNDIVQYALSLAFRDFDFDAGDLRMLKKMLEVLTQDDYKLPELFKENTELAVKVLTREEDGMSLGDRNIGRADINNATNPTSF